MLWQRCKSRHSQRTFRFYRHKALQHSRDGFAWLQHITDILSHGPLTRKAKLRVAHAPGTFSPPPPVSDPDMYHGTCVTHVPRCMPGSLNSGFLCSRWRGKRSRHSRRMRNPQVCLSAKKPITGTLSVLLLLRVRNQPFHHRKSPKRISLVMSLLLALVNSLTTGQTNGRWYETNWPSCGVTLIYNSCFI